MPANQSISSKLSNFPMTLLVTTIVVTFVTIFMFTITSLYVSRLLDETLMNTLEASDLHGEIMLLDESLGMSARLAVVTGDKSWEEKYNQYDTELTSAIDNAMSVVPKGVTRDSVKNADLANKKLVHLEHDAFQLARQGKVADAKKILFGQEYNTVKQSYHQNMLTFHNELNQALSDDVEFTKKVQRVSLLFMVIDFLLLIIAWLYTYRNVSIWKVELEKKIQSEVHYKQEIENARHFLKEVLVINKMNDRLQTCQTSAEAYVIVAHTAKELFPDLSGGLVIRHPSSDDMETVQKWGDAQCLMTNFSIDDCWALREGHVYIVNQISEGIICQHFNPLPLSGYLCVPLIVQDGAIGLLELNAPYDEMIPDHQQQLAITFCEVLRLSLGNIFLREALSEQVIQDPLTGLFNRRYLDKTLPVLLRRSIRNKKHICVAMLDLDYFKKINDTYGHEAGDEVLKVTGALLKNNMREYDTACRYGGEEFLIIMEAELEDAITKLRTISQELSSAHIAFNDKPLPAITLSIGVAEAPTHASTADEMIRLADEALYAAKSAGRNRIEVAKLLS